MIDATQAPRRPVLLVILDGFGVNPSKIHNGVAEAHTPRFDEYFFRYSHVILNASGSAVGLPEGQMGNSEVGHVTLGSGCVIRQDLVLIDDAIADGSLFTNPVLCHAMEKAAAQTKVLHLMGLVSDGGVHSHVEHLLALIELCRRYQVRPLLHMLTDGRDTPPRSAGQYLPAIEAALAQAEGRVVTVSGRYYAMDRDKRWDRVEKAWRAMVLGEGRVALSAGAAIEAAYAAGETDEFILPTVLPGYQGIGRDESLISFNFRKDRPRQMAAALALGGFDGFDRGGAPLVAVTCMMDYDPRLGLPYAFEPETPPVTLNRLIGAAGLRQFHCAETEKYAHVTYFFNGGTGESVAGEDHHLIPSSKVATYDLKPEMSAREVADSVVEAIGSGRYSFIVVNFANGDMVGHTGIRDAVIAAVETLDREAGRVLDAAVAADYSVILTADHGNCDLLVDPLTDEPHTQHTTHPVPCLIIDAEPWVLAPAGGLSSIAPTVLQLMGLDRPPQMTGRSLLVRRLESRPIPAVDKLAARADAA
jgi:2,3-bisphosphoglycerate-independent phosphoglycerate mutase